MRSPYGSTDEFLADDGHGNGSVVTGSTKNLVCSARFDPFGNPEGAAAGSTCDVVGATSPSNEMFFRGARRDSGTGDYQFGARTYDPSKASFLTPDAYRANGQQNDLSVGVDPLTRNTYSYVNGDPVNLVDPDGHMPRCNDCVRVVFQTPEAKERAREAQLKQIGSASC